MKSKEAQLQSECVRWFRYQYKDHAMLLFAIPNGGSRNIIEATNLKRQGVVAGVADMFLAIPRYENNWYGLTCTHNGFFIEFKYGKNGQTTEQKNFQIEVEQQGYLYALVNSFDQFKELIETYLK